MPKSETLLLRRWPCWPGPYSRRLTGLLGRPQTFWPIRRSILYFASWRLVIASSFAVGFEDRALLCSPPQEVTDRSEPKRTTQTTGRETLREPEGPRNGRYLGGMRV